MRTGTKSRSKKQKRSTKISDHFSERDFQCKCGKCSNELKISLGLIGGLEMLRSKLRKRIEIIKGYQCTESREAAGSFRKNFHGMGIAVDIRVDDCDLKTVFKAAEEIPEFKGIGINFTDNVVHVDTRKEDVRQEWITELGKRVELTLENRAQYLLDQK